jgi:hypothetical protein
MSFCILVTAGRAGARAGIFTATAAAAAAAITAATAAAAGCCLGAVVCDRNYIAGP